MDNSPKLEITCLFIFNFKRIVHKLNSGFFGWQKLRIPDYIGDEFRWESGYSAIIYNFGEQHKVSSRSHDQNRFPFETCGEWKQNQLENPW